MNFLYKREQNGGAPLHHIVIERHRQLRANARLESNLATTRGQMLDLEERMGTQEARQMAHATDSRETGRAR